MAEFEMIGIGLDRPETRTSDGLNFDTFTEGTLQKLLQTIQEIIQIDRLRVERLPTGECEQAASQCCCALRAPLGIGQCPLKIHAVSQAAAVSLGGLKVAKHDHQKIIEVVRDPTAELAYRFELLRSG